MEGLVGPSVPFQKVAPTRDQIPSLPIYAEDPPPCVKCRSTGHMSKVAHAYRGEAFIKDAPFEYLTVTCWRCGHETFFRTCDSAEYNLVSAPMGNLRDVAEEWKDVGRRSSVRGESR